VTIQARVEKGVAGGREFPSTNSAGGRGWKVVFEVKTLRIIVVLILGNN